MEILWIKPVGWGPEVGWRWGGFKKTGCRSTFQTSVTVYWRHQLPVASFHATCTATDVCKNPPCCRLVLKEGQTSLTFFLGSLVWPKLSCVTLIPSQQWASFRPLFPSAPCIPPLLFPTRPPTEAAVGGACEQRIMWRDGWFGTHRCLL